MSIKVTLGDRRSAETGPWARRFTEQATPGTPLEALFQTLSKHHPDLAPILEDATQQDDLEIRVNDRPIDPQAANDYKIRDGDTVSLFLK